MSVELYVYKPAPVSNVQYTYNVPQQSFLYANPRATAIPDPYRTLIKFPAGEWHVAVSGEIPTGLDSLAVVRWEGSDDLIALAVWADAVRNAGGRPYAAIPYVPGARQDRLPGDGTEELGARVYARLINSLNLEFVWIYDPHSPVVSALLDRSCEVEIFDWIAHELEEYEFEAVIIPDAGAGKRATAVADALGIPTIQALKKRDPLTGKLSGFRATDPVDDAYRYLVVDDICDGGGTFMGLAAATHLPRASLFLWVTHGVFSGTAAGLQFHYEEIHTTDSVVPKNPDLPHQFITHSLTEGFLHDFVAEVEDRKAN